MTRVRVLFVCTGNQYRSPIAERLFAAGLGPHAERFHVGSAGTVARTGAPMIRRTAEVIAELGGRTDGFTSTRLTTDLVVSADLVLGLAREHREAAVRLSPTALRRCFVLEEFVRLAGDIPAGGDMAEVVARAAAARGRRPPAAPEADDVVDPDGLPEEALRRCAVQIDQAVREMAAALTGAVRAVG